MSGGAGYVLGREALKRFVEQALPDKKNVDKIMGGGQKIWRWVSCIFMIFFSDCYNEWKIHKSYVEIVK